MADVKKERNFHSWGVVLAMAVVFFSAGLGAHQFISREAMVYEAVCDQLIANTTAGRQALICSVWWPPLNTLLRLPVTALHLSENNHIASLIVSALSGAAILFMLNRILREWGVGWTRYLLMAGLVLNPLFIRQCFNGSTVTTVSLLVLFSGWGLAMWLETKQLRYLAFIGAGTAALSLASFHMTCWALGLLLILSVDQIFLPSGRKHESEAVLILGWLPILYSFGTWVLVNWLIMGDAIYFMRSLFSGEESANPTIVTGSSLLFQLFIFIMSLVITVPSLIARNTPGTALGLLGFMSLCAGGLLSWLGISWSSPAFLSICLPLSIAGLGYLWRFNAPSARRLKPLAVALLLVVVVLSQIFPRSETARTGDCAETVERDRGIWLPRISSHVLKKSRYSRVFVCGHRGFLFARGAGNLLYEHVLDLDTGKIRRDYKGQRIYILVPAPAGGNVLDSVYWKYRKVYAGEQGDMLYDSDWGDWRLFEIIQAPEKEDNIK